MLVLEPEEVASVRATVKALADERDRLKRQLEVAEAALHRARIQIDALKKEVEDARKA